MKNASAIPMSLLLLLAGCAVAPDTPGSWLANGKSTAKTGTTAQTQPVSNNGSSLGSDETTATTGATTSNKAGGTSVNTSADITVPGATGPALTTPVGPTNPMMISAANGGRYTSPDGTLTADIPPGTLTKDAVVAITPNSTSGLKVSQAFVPGIDFSVDLGGARITPDHAILVSTKVDDRFVQQMQLRDPNFSADKYNLKKDSKGNWVMTMAVNGPVTQVPQRPAFADFGPKLIENGALPLPGAAAATKAMRRLLDFAVDPAPASGDNASNSGAPSGVSSSTDCATWGDTIHSDVPASIGKWYQDEGQGKFSCATYDGRGWYMNIYHDLTQQKQTCNGSPNPSASASVVNTADIPTHTVWDSDDPAVAGKDAAGADIRFDFPWSPQNGPRDVVADDKGLAKSFTVEGLPVSATACTDVGPAKGTLVQGTAKAGMATLELKCPLFSPHITFHVESPGALPAKLTVKFTLDGKEQTKDLVPASAGAKTGDVTFYLIVADNKDHEVKVTGVDAGADWGMTPPGPDAQQVHRNGEYTFNLKLQNMVAH